MKIFVEASPMMNQRSGIGQFTKRLLEATVAADKTNKYTAFFFRSYFSRRPLTQPIKPAKNFSYRMIRWLPAVIYYQSFKRLTTLPIDVMLGSRPDIILFPNFVSWPVINKKTLVVPFIHDLSFIHYGQYSSPQNLHYMRKFVPKTLARANHVLTISENSKREIIEYYGVGEDKISVVNPAIDHSDYYPRSSEEITGVSKKYSLPKQYFLFTGTIEPRKNIQGILDAYALLDESIRAEYGLVLAGGKGWVDRDIQARLDKYTSLNIVQTGYVDDEDLAALFSGAALFLFPSFYEGFGIPPLEAMACGVPVITANNSSLPEVIGDAGILLDKLDPQTIATSITTVVQDSALQAKLKKAGLKQAATFSWETSAAALIDIFKTLKDAKRG